MLHLMKYTVASTYSLRASSSRRWPTWGSGIREPVFLHHPIRFDTFWNLANEECTVFLHPNSLPTRKNRFFDSHLLPVSTPSNPALCSSTVEIPFASFTHCFTYIQCLYVCMIMNPYVLIIYMYVRQQWRNQKLYFFRVDRYIWSWISIFLILFKDLKFHFSRHCILNKDNMCNSWNKSTIRFNMCNKIYFVK